MEHRPISRPYRGSVLFAVFAGATAAAQGVGPGGGGAGDGTEGIVIDSVLCLGLPLFLLGGLFFMVRFIVRGARLVAIARARSMSALDERLHRVASKLISVEHSLRLAEDSELREMLDQSTLSEQRARDEVDKARAGKVGLEAAGAQVHAAEESTELTEARARALFGSQASLSQGERAGCFFCARPLANDSFREQVPFTQGSELHPVMACPPCASAAAAGQPSPIVVRMELGERMLHWSELERYDPYTHHHKPYPGVRTVPASYLASQRPLSELAARAAGKGVAPAS